MLEARSLLLKTHESITKIAATVGFTDPYYFSRRFSQLHKVSPKSWRKKYQTQVA
jgi:AraC-like DNA-binding protein